jgi:hypothetical protein
LYLQGPWLVVQKRVESQWTFKMSVPFLANRYVQVGRKTNLLLGTGALSVFLRLCWRFIGLMTMPPFFVMDSKLASAEPVACLKKDDFHNVENCTTMHYHDIYDGCLW